MLRYPISPDSFKLLFSFTFSFLIVAGCEPIATDFDDLEEAVRYQAAEMTTPPSRVDSLLVMTWNIRYGAARIPWFGDSCGDRVILTKTEVTNALNGLAGKISEVNPDIVILQEVDVGSKRSDYIDQVQWLLDHTDLNYGAYASYWQIQFIPSDGLGRMDAGNAILSRWKFTEMERLALPLRGDQDALTQYFYLRRNILKVKVALPGQDNFYVVGVHTAAFSTDDTKKGHIDRFKETLDALDDMGALFAAGGDLNELPPESDSTNYCDEARCPEDPEDVCPDGSDYGPERDWLTGLYNRYNSAISLGEYRRTNGPYFTYGRAETDAWDRKLDYLFTNGRWIAGSDSTHQDAIELSDHCPVTAKLVLTP
ncbi:MAG: endonuclease/exonuclease/phosphatase family protein [Fidelibacterota bacterium]